LAKAFVQLTVRSLTVPPRDNIIAVDYRRRSRERVDSER
jgi:hypothetical protein